MKIDDLIIRQKELEVRGDQLQNLQRELTDTFIAIRTGKPSLQDLIARLQEASNESK